MTELILIRHGQSYGNLECRFLGHTDKDITPLGVSQAECTAAALVNWVPDAIYASNLLRAMHTAEPFAIQWHLPIRPCVQLREIFAGEWEDMPFEELQAKFGDSYHTFRTNIGHAHPEGGESVAHVRERVTGTIRAIADQYPNGRILIVSHATVIHSFICEVMGLTADTANHLALPVNASMTTVRYDGNKFILCSYSSAEHLGDLKTARPPLC